MKKLLIISISFLFAGVALVAAEENVDLVQPDYIGVTHGNEEHDTFAYSAAVAANLVMGINSQCDEAPCEAIVVNPDVDPVYVGTVRKTEEKNTFGYAQ